MVITHVRQFIAKTININQKTVTLFFNSKKATILLHIWKWQKFSFKAKEYFCNFSIESKIISK